MNEVTGKDLAALLFTIHTHDEATEKIVYFEEDLLPILEAIGLPKPIWEGSMTEGSMTVKEFKKKLKNKKND